MHCVELLLQPRTFRYKKIQKTRKILPHKTSIKLAYGTSGLLLLQSVQLTSLHLTKFKLFLKRAVKKVDKTKRQFWFNGFPHLPLTRKSTGSRMGKGKGKAVCWFIRIKGNSCLLEFQNLRYGRSRYFVNHLGHRLNVPVKAIFMNNKTIAAPFSKKKQVFFNVRWN